MMWRSGGYRRQGRDPADDVRATSLLTVRDISYDVPDRRLLDSVALDVAPGEVVGVIGPNGAGKSTLLRCIAGLIPPGTGTILLRGVPVGDLGTVARARQLAMVPQDIGLDFSFSVSEIVMMGRYAHLSRYALETRADRELVRRAITRVGIGHLADRSVATLSGGERQLVLMAKAIAQQAPLLVLDEPVSALDVRHQLSVMELLRGLAGEGRGVLAALHDLNLAARFCDRLVVLSCGRKAADGDPAEVLSIELMAAVYGVHALVHHHVDSSAPLVEPRSVVDEDTHGGPSAPVAPHSPENAPTSPPEPIHPIHPSRGLHS